MRKLLFALLFLAVSTSLQAQEIGELVMRQEIVSYGDIERKSASLFEQYFKADKIDSAKLVLDYWEKKAGMSEELFRVKLLMALKEHKYSDDIFADNAVDYLHQFRSMRESVMNPMNRRFYNNGLGFEFNEFTSDAAKGLKTEYSEGSMEYLLCEFYEGHTGEVFSKLLTDKSYSESTVAKEIRADFEGYNRMPEAHISWLTGVWVPTGGLSILGVHPELGFQVGTKYKKMSYDFIMSCRFVSSASRYTYNDNGEPNSTKHFFGMHFGADLGRDIFVHKRHEVQLLGGVGYEGFDVKKGDTKKDIDHISTGSLNLNCGLGYRYYTNGNNYWGLRVKYNFLDYTRLNVIDYKGNAVSIHLTLGGLSNILKSSGMNYYGVKLRQ